MKRLVLLRHAKSAWDNPALADHDRPLNPRGRAAALAMARAVTELAPDLVLCSDAARTRETATLLVEAGAIDEARIIYDAGLYLAEPDMILARLNALAGDAATVMIVGHNPGLQALATHLIRSGDPAGRATLAEKFPTAGLAVIDFDSAAWPGTTDPVSVAEAGRLSRFVTPRALAMAG